MDALEPSSLEGLEYVEGVDALDPCSPCCVESLESEDGVDALDPCSLEGFESVEGAWVQPVWPVWLDVLDHCWSRTSGPSPKASRRESRFSWGGTHARSADRSTVDSTAQSPMVDYIVRTEKVVELVEYREGVAIIFIVVAPPSRDVNAQETRAAATTGGFVDRLQLDGWWNMPQYIMWRSMYLTHQAIIKNDSASRRERRRLNTRYIIALVAVLPYPVQYKKSGYRRPPFHGTARQKHTKCLPALRGARAPDAADVPGPEARQTLGRVAHCVHAAAGRRVREGAAQGHTRARAAPVRGELIALCRAVRVQRAEARQAGGAFQQRGHRGERVARALAAGWWRAPRWSTAIEGTRRRP
ncbi:hypothetical protein ON010_g5820 [Phytophthora cinnamomi]|nr:hypothetical protein ON010_g5820 [Phytophthora cinnamomi]